MQNITKRELLLSFITKSLLITALIDIMVNLRPILYFVIFMIFVLLFSKRYYARLNSSRVSKVIRSRIFIFLFPLIILTCISYKVYILKLNSNPILSNSKWRVDQIIKDDRTIYLDDKKSCDTIRFWNYGVMFLKEKGVYHLKYRLDVNNKLKILSSEFYNFSQSGCAGQLPTDDIGFRGWFNYNLSSDKLVLKDSRIEITLSKYD
jgi:hypothetical protein